jgi:DNA invertase Pin-like site-specific DNA recombinase
MRVALYARVSTKQHGQDVDTQLYALRAWAKAKRHKVVEYADRGWSGTKESRPELDRLMRDVRRGEIEIVAVARFDRFARSVRHLVSALEEFRKLKVDFVSLNESIDTTTPVGRMVFTIIAAIAEFERAVIAERVRMGLDRARSQGKRIGRPRREVDEKEIARLVKAGNETILAIARQAGVARSTVRAIAHRQAAPVRQRAGRGKK